MNANPLILAILTTALLGSPALAANSVLAPATKAGSATVAMVVGMDKPPTVLKSVLPVYPKELGELGIQGLATVEMEINAAGRVIHVKLVSSNEPEFGERALIAAKHWTFVPASAQGKPIASRVSVPFEFVLPKLLALDGS